MKCDAAEEEDDDGCDDDGWHVDPNRNSSEKRNRFGNASNHKLGNGKVNGNEHEMEIGIENQYANHGWDGDANANWKRNGNSHDRDIEDDGDNGDINGDHNAREGFLNRRLGVETERSGVPYRESKPSAHRHRTARTTRQINGAKSFGG